jgi:hypothetical protein
LLQNVVTPFRRTLREELRENFSRLGQVVLDHEFPRRPDVLELFRSVKVCRLVASLILPQSDYALLYRV